MRKYYIDNLRWMNILLLFPYHVFIMYNTWGENYYVRGVPVPALAKFVQFCAPWFMPLMFVLAGMNTVYALERRTAGQYLMERVKKLLVPFLAGLVLFVPALTYYAERFHNGYTGDYFQQYILFFTKETDLVGYTGGLTPAHLWFILYLFVISIIALPFVLFFRKCRYAPFADRLSLPVLAALSAAVWCMTGVLNLNGKSIGRYLALFLLGAAVLSREAVQAKLEKYRLPLAAVWLASSALYLIRNPSAVLRGGAIHLVGWLGILALIGLARKHLNFRSRVTAYFSGRSFLIYIIHLQWIVAAAFYVMRATPLVPVQVFVTLAASFLLTLITSEAVRRLPGVRLLFAVNKRTADKAA